MMTPEDVHRDVGAYALGVLDPRDTARFERHLMACRSCPHELAELSPVAALLSQVDPREVALTAHPAPQPRKAEPRKAEPRKAEPRKAEPRKAEPRKADPRNSGAAARTGRRRGGVRRALTLAACLALFVAGGVVAVSLGLTGNGLPGVPAMSPVAQRLHAADPNTGADATVQMEAKRWGSQVTLRLARVDGPLVCRLVAVSKAGRSEVVMGWSVPPGGYGTTTRPEPLVLHGGTDLRPSDLSRLEIRTIAGALLVAVPT
jgi:anti-sigma factor RsiW